MNMTRKEAARILQNGSWWDCLPDDMSDADMNPLQDALDVALSALRPITREQVEMMRATLDPTTLPDGTKTVATKCSECGAHNLITHLFCWRCGSPLTDVAVDILVRRLEETLKDGD